VKSRVSSLRYILNQINVLLFSKLQLNRYKSWNGEPIKSQNQIWLIIRIRNGFPFSEFNFSSQSQVCSCTFFFALVRRASFLFYCMEFGARVHDSDLNWSYSTFSGLEYKNKNSRVYGRRILKGSFRQPYVILMSECQLSSYILHVFVSICYMYSSYAPGQTCIAYLMRVPGIIIIYFSIVGERRKETHFQYQ
jgi:hypothetical protein